MTLNIYAGFQFAAIKCQRKACKVLLIQYSGAIFAKSLLFTPNW